MVKNYVPLQGDICYINFNPTKGHEQAGLRPAIVISNNVFNNKAKMIIVCPITSNEKEFPTYYLLKETKKIRGSVLCEHIRSIDYETRDVNFIEKMPHKDFEEVIMLVNACIDIN